MLIFPPPHQLDYHPRHVGKEEAPEDERHHLGESLLPLLEALGHPRRRAVHLGLHMLARSLHLVEDHAVGDHEHHAGHGQPAEEEEVLRVAVRVAHDGARSGIKHFFFFLYRQMLAQNLESSKPRCS